MPVDNGIPLSILDYSFNETDCSEQIQYLPIAMEDTFGLSDRDKFPSGKEMNIESQFAANKQKINVSNNGIAPLSMSDYSLMSLPCESDGTELGQYLTVDNTFELRKHEMFPFGEELKGQNSFHIFPLNEELINNCTMSGQLNENYHSGNSQTLNDISVPGEQYRDEMLPNKDILLSKEILNWEGSESVSVCAKDSSDHKDMNGEEEKGPELVQLLLESAQMIGEGKYDHAVGLVSKCQNSSCQLGNPTQRLSNYMCSALQDRIKRQTQGMLNNGAKTVPDFAFNIDGEFDKTEFCSLLAYSNRVLPYINVMQFTSVQAIIDVVGNARRIHVIDLGMRIGSHWTVLMEYLSHRSVSSSIHRLQLLKITAVGMNGEELRKSGKRLQQLAKSLAIPFSYNIMEIPNIEEIKEGLFSVKSGEALAVYAPVVLRSLLYDPVLLDNLLSYIRRLRPMIMVNVEIEAQHNSPSFVNRFREVLFHCMTYFDLLDVTLKDRNDMKRVKHEELITGSQIRNMIVYEGKERTVRHVRNDVWRCFYKQAGFREKSFSFQAMYQARLLLGEHASGEYYTLESNGNAIVVKWKGSPLIALSA
ncbi:hypothetical protein SUGI_1328520 [Cryptomeria japonica]|uniref:GRAS family transcription factor n=1 Tax=Cryptomeria japonica TaxID=3369 RepID=A0AAD3RQ82_CRYJA|nr:scarecrow-like protein 18 [Cryptomeria japonica]GLJ57430.1 hypothetical protein SUGI_1328520 [Cryptomeria japonica]